MLEEWAARGQPTCSVLGLSICMKWIINVHVFWHLNCLI